MVILLLLLMHFRLSPSEMLQYMSVQYKSVFMGKVCNLNKPYHSAFLTNNEVWSLKHFGVCSCGKQDNNMLKVDMHSL